MLGGQAGIFGDDGRSTTMEPGSPTLSGPFGRITPAHGAADSDAYLSSIRQFESSTVFMKAESLISVMLRLRGDLLKAQRSGHAFYPHLISQTERILYDVRARRVSSVMLPGVKSARVFVMPD